MTKILLIPCARTVPVELEAEFGRILPAMIPLDSKPALHYIVEPLRREGYRTVIAVDEESDAIERYVERHDELDAQIVNVGATRSLGETVLMALHTLDAMPDHLVINFGDTVVTDRMTGSRTTVACAEVADAYRWTTVEHDISGEITNLLDKDRRKPGEPPHRALVGAFAFADPAGFRNALRRAMQPETPGDLDPFYVALREHYNAQPPRTRMLADVDGWWDLGHLDTYYETKRRFFVGRRFFNDVRIDGRRGVLRKTSDDTDKLNREIAWYLRLPHRLQPIAPRVLDYRIDMKSPYLELEYYGYPTLSDTLLFGRLDPGAWHGILGALDGLLDDLQSFRLEPPMRGDLVAAARDMYEGKTRRRLELVLDDPHLAPLRGDRLWINGRPCPGLDTMLERLPAVAEAVELYEFERFSIVHGDLCASNILYDRRNRLLRVVDPRGSFGPLDLYGDPAYDLAKLCHSFESHYDFLLNGLFDFDLEEHADGARIRLEPHETPSQRAIREAFTEWMDQRAGRARLRIALIESLLFASMLPLHSDRPQSQLAFAARGLERFAIVAERAALGGSVFDTSPDTIIEPAAGDAS